MSIRDRIISYMVGTLDPIGADALAFELGLPPKSVRPRVTELLQDELLVATGEFTMTASLHPQRLLMWDGDTDGN